MGATHTFVDLSPNAKPRTNVQVCTLHPSYRPLTGTRRPGLRTTILGSQAKLS